MKSVELKKPGFFEGVFVAIIASVVGVMLYTSLTLLFGVDVGFRLMATSVFSAYLLYLLWRSPKKRGRMTALFFWGVILFVTWLIDPSVLFYLMIQITAICLIRALIFHQSLFSTSLDMVLSAFSLVAAVGAYLSTHSVLIALWVLFLIQALFGVIPNQWKRKEGSTTANDNDRFMQAYHNAEVALRKFSTL